MSTLSGNRPEFDFWEFVHCSKCHMPFISNSVGTPSAPFWLTECGHVVCNNHLNSDQSCAECGERGIQLVPLQKDMNAPMSDWFRSVPQAFDTIAYAAKFQMETMATLVRYWRDKYAKQKRVFERLREEHAELKALRQEVGMLRTENLQLRQGYAGEDDADVPNHNGKRARTESLHNPRESRTDSSPRSIVTPVGANRLTLPPGHQQPDFSRNGQPIHDEHLTVIPTLQHETVDVTHRERGRPGSSRLKQYSYVPPHTPRSSTTSGVLSYAQAGPTRQASIRQSQADDHVQPTDLTHIPGREGHYQRTVQPTSSGATNIPLHRSAGSRVMPPPPTPQLGRGALPQGSSFRSPTMPQLSTTSSAAQRFVPATPSNRFPVASDTSLATNRLVPQRSAQSQSLQPQRFFASSARPSPSTRVSNTSGLQGGSMANAGGVGNRGPFVPGA